MSSDPGKTHYVGDGCQPAHDPRIDQAPLLDKDAGAWVHRQAELQAQIARQEQRFREVEAEWVERYETLEAEVERLQVELAALNHISAGHLQACVVAEADAERLRTLIDKHNDECRECPVIELDSDKANYV
jgi:hypothetical protein